MRPFALVVLLALCVASNAARAVDDDALYRGHALVNKYDEALARGYGENLAEVLVKVSGDPRLLADPRLDALKADAKAVSTGVRFHDLWESIPIHDEQGTRDRPYDMWVSFNKGRIAEILKTLGRTVWTGPRPTVVPFIGLKDLRGRTFVLASDGVRGIDQREALAVAATAYGLDYHLPTTAILTGEALTYPRLASEHVTPSVDGEAGNVALMGVLQASENPPGWRVSWRLVWQGATIRWSLVTPSFDAAFRAGFAGAEQVFAGNGIPASAP